jgi:hypothetical protein
MSPQEREYYRGRAESERERAATASSVAAEIHIELARLYEKIIELDEESPQPELYLVEVMRQSA